MPSFVHHTNRTVVQLDDIDVQPPCIPLTPTPTPSSAQKPRLTRSTLAALIAQQEREDVRGALPPAVSSSTWALPPTSSAFSFSPSPRRRRPWYLRAEDASASLFCCEASRPPPARTPPLTVLAFSVMALVWLLLTIALVLDSFALTYPAIEVLNDTSVTFLPTPVSHASTLGSFSYCQEGLWSVQLISGGSEWSFAADPQCWSIDNNCLAGEFSLSQMMGGTGSVSCGSFIAFRAWLVLAFLIAGAAVITAVLHLVWPSRWWNGFVTALTGLSSFALLLTLCFFASIIRSSAASPAIASSTSLHFSIAAFVLLLLSSLLWTLSEYRRTHRAPPLHSASPTAISMSVPPVQLTEESDRRGSLTSAYSLDEDEGALLEVRAPTTAEMQVKVKDAKEMVGEAPGGDEQREKAVTVVRKRRKERMPNKEREVEEEEVEDHELAEMMAMAPVVEGVEEGEGETRDTDVVRMDEETVVELQRW